MKSAWRIFAAIFSAGIVSLLLELSLLREFVYVIGSSAFSNSLVISVFLAGLAAGTYFGLWKRFQYKTEVLTRIKFTVLQIILIGFIFVFYVTKEYFIYVSQSEPVILAYFILATFVPSFIAGASYAVAVELLYRKGERFIVYIYAVSTIGNVTGGLLNGYVFVYLVGIQASYAAAAFCAAVAVLLVYPFKKKFSALIPALFLFFPAAAVQSNVINRMVYRFDALLYTKYSPGGLVEVWKTNDGQAVEMTVNNVHQYYSYDWDNRVHAQWADTTLEITRRPSDVLLLGYGSGVSTAAYLASDRTTRVDTVENTAPVMEAGELFFPEEYRRSITDPRSHIIVDDFRKFIRFTDRKYDIVLLDHSITDPYYTGFFTLEFFDQLKRILKPRGVIGLLGAGLSYKTTRTAFPYVYRYVKPGRELISDSGYFLSMEPFDGSVVSDYALEGDATGSEPVYSDHGIRGNSVRTALSAIKKRVSHSQFQ